MDDWTLTLCGRVALTRDGVPPPAGSLGAKALALAAYLALEPRAHSRDELTALLWGEYSEDKARASFRQALRQLRTVLGDRIRADRVFVELIGPVSCDVLQFLRNADTDPATAVNTDVLRFLDGLSVRHCDAFEEWAERTREALRSRHARALAAVARDALARRDWRTAAESADRWLAVEPHAEPAVLLAVEAHHMRGDRAGAVAIFSDYLACVGNETGREPGSRLRNLMRRIEASPESVPHSASNHAPAATAPAFACALLGRTAEWQRLRTAWTLSRSGRPELVVVEGEPGSGKSRLTADFARWVSAGGGAILRARASEASSQIPLATAVELLQPLADAPAVAGADPVWIAEVARLVPALARRFPGVTTLQPVTPIDRWRLFEGVAQLLIAMAEETPIAVFVDDVHCCDADSCALLQFLVQRLEQAAVLWCMTLTPGAAERDGARIRFERALRADATPLVLAPLQQADLRALVQELGRPADAESADRFARRLHAATDGNPYYVMELLKSLFTSGWLHADPESGEWSGPVGWTEWLPLPTQPRVHAATAQRIGSLPDDQRELLITLAMADGVCSARLLSHIHGISRLRAAAMADGLVERHLAVESAGSYRCAQPVVAHAVREELTTARRQEVRSAVEFALEQLAESEVRAPVGNIATAPASLPLARSDESFQRTL